MKKYGIVMVVFLAVAALMTAPAAFAAEQTKSGTSGTSSGVTTQSDTSSSTYQSATQESGMSATLRGSDLMDKSVVNRNDEELGSVEDIIIGRDGKVSYVVLSHGGLLGVGDTLIPVPFSAIEQGTGEDDNLILNVSKEELENAPSFARTEWPDFSDSTYENDVHGYFGATPAGSGSGIEGEMDTSTVKPKGSESGMDKEIDKTEQTPAPKSAD